MVKKADMVDVQATGPIRHGVKDEGVTNYAEGDVFAVPADAAVRMAVSGAVIEPGSKDKAAQAVAAGEKAIEAANARADADRKKAAGAESKAKG